MRITSGAGTREVTLKTGSSFFSEGIDWHEVLNVGDTTVSYLMIEPKLTRTRDGQPAIAAPVWPAAIRQRILISTFMIRGSLQL